MIRFACEYGPAPIFQEAAANLAGEEILPRIAARRPWFHHVILTEKTKLVDPLPRNLRSALPTFEQLEHEQAKG